MEKLKIGFVGINFVTKHLLNALASSHDVMAWNRAETDKPFSPKIKLIICDVPWVWIHKKITSRGSQLSLPFYFKGLLPSLWKEKPDVVVVMDFFRLWFIQALLYALFHPKVIFVVHSETKKPPQSFWSRIFFYLMVTVVRVFQWRVHIIITYSETGTNYLTKLFPHISSIELALPIDENTPLYTDSTPGESIHILVPARFVPFKRHLDIISAVESLPTSVDIKIDFAGFGNAPAPHTNIIKRRLNTSSAKSRISIIDPVQQPFNNYYQLLAKYDAILLASAYEPVGAVIPASLRCGRPTITSDSVGANTYVTSDKTGYIFPTGDTTALATLLHNLNKEQLVQMGKQAAEEMRTTYSSTTVAQRFINIISQ